MPSLPVQSGRKVLVYLSVLDYIGKRGVLTFLLGNIPAGAKHSATQVGWHISHICKTRDYYSNGKLILRDHELPQTIQNPDCMVVCWTTARRGSKLDKRCFTSGLHILIVPVILNLLNKFHKNCMGSGKIRCIFLILFSYEARSGKSKVCFGYK